MELIKQWSDAQAVIDQCKKQVALEKSVELQKFIKERNRTFWKQTLDYHESYMHVFVDKAQSHYTTVFSFEIHTNGSHEIKSKTFNGRELKNFLDGISEEAINQDRDNDECDYEDFPKVNIQRMSEEEFKKQVQEKVLDTYSIGLTFKS
jgi:hypothetical protein